MAISSTAVIKGIGLALTVGGSIVTGVATAIDMKGAITKEVAKEVAKHLGK